MRCLAIMTTDGIDTPSSLGRFRWEIIGNSCLPCFVRNDGENYVATRIAEARVLFNFFEKFNNSLFSCFVLDSFAMTSIEIQLLDHINKEHCEGALSKTNFDIYTDFAVKVNDLRQLYAFIDACNKRLESNFIRQREKFGFVRIDEESVVPFVVKDDVKYVPVFYFDGELESLKSSETTINGWDLAYIKFLCKVHGINATLYDVDELKVVSLDVIRSYFPDNTRFDDFWPTNVVNLGKASKPEESAYASMSWFKAPLERWRRNSSKSSNFRTPEATTVANRCEQQSSTSATLCSTSTLIHHLTRPPAYTMSSTHSVINRIHSTSNKVAQMTYSSNTAHPKPIAPANTVISQMNRTGVRQSQSQSQNSINKAYSLPRSNSQPSAISFYVPSTVVGHAPFLGYVTSTTTMPSNTRNVSTNQGRKRSSTNQNDLIDLSTPPSSPKTYNEQLTNTMYPRVAAYDYSKRSNLIEIPNYPIHSNSPYKTQIIVFREKQIFIINAKPDDFSEALVPLIDVSNLFFNVGVYELYDRLLRFPVINLYIGNTIQKQILRDHNKCGADGSVTLLMRYRDLEKHFNNIMSLCTATF